MLLLDLKHDFVFVVVTPSTHERARTRSTRQTHSKTLSTSTRHGATLDAQHAVNAAHNTQRTLDTLDTTHSAQHTNTNTPQERIEQIVDRSEHRIMSIFEKFGECDYIGEPFSIVEHSMQVAQMAENSHEEEQAILSCLLHDIGHLCGLEAGSAPAMDGNGVEEHERVGAEFLGKLGFSDTVCYLTLHHVNAKRYLCTRRPGYYDTLTDASKATLRFQGGPMTEEECLEVEKDPRWPLVLRMRTYDEGGKNVEVKADHPDVYREALRQNLRISLMSQLERGEQERFPVSPYAGSYVLSDEQLARWDADGYLVIKNVLAEEVVKQLDSMTDTLAQLPVSDEEVQFPWLVHHEMGLDDSINICRVENFCKHDARWGQLCFGVLQDLVSQAYREPAVLFKDKLNFKGPGGGSFLAHQDATAYSTGTLAKRHISVMVAVDESTPDNGPLEVATGKHLDGIFANAKGAMTPEAEASMEFVPVHVKPGDVVLFDSYLPHRSNANNSNGWRRLAYLTYNKLSEGDLHEAYYATKAAAFKSGNAGSISINSDFGGKIVKKTKAKT